MIDESTRVMGAASPPTMDRTMVAGASMSPPAGATQMGVTVVCPICRTSNSGMEAYCGECGFLLSSAPGQEEAAPEEAAGPAIELVENASGRRFKLKQGPNTVGRENCDILLMDGTVSRRHAEVVLESGTVVVTDFGSTNGSKVNGAALAPNQPTPVPSGATVQFGTTALTLSVPAEAAPVAPADVTVAVSAPPSVIPDQTLVGAPSVEEEVALEAPAESRPPAESQAPAEPQAAAPAQESVHAIESELHSDAIAILQPTSGQGIPIDVRAGTFTIGRRAGNDIVISDDPYISGAHAMLTCDSSGSYITDVGSTNGTSVNGAKLEPNARQLLLDGDEVLLGQTTYRYETVPARAEPLAEPAVPAPQNPILEPESELTGASPDEVIGE